MYGPFSNQRLIGRAITGRRQEVRLTTKVGNLRNEYGSRLGNNERPEYVKQACEASLTLFGVDYIDLYYLH